MAKFVRGPFQNVEEVKAELKNLMDKGYRDQDITIVTSQEEDARILDEETPMQVMDDDAQNIISSGERPFWEQLTDAFSGYFFNYGNHDDQEVSNDQGAADEDPRTLLAGYRENLENGEIVLLVDDSLLNKESRFNFDVLDDIQAENHDHEPAREEKDADPAKVMEETVPEQDSHPDIEDTKEVLGQETPYVPGDAPAGKSVTDLQDEDEEATRRRTFVPGEKTAGHDWSDERSTMLDLEKEAVPTDDPDIHGNDVVDLPENNDVYSQSDAVPEDRSGLTDADLEEDPDAGPGFYRENLAVEDDEDYPEVIDADRDTLVTYDPDGDDEDPLRRK